MLVREDYKKELKMITSPIAIGENSPRVGIAQQWLNIHRYYNPRYKVNISIDNSFGPATQSAVKAFQYASGLEATGVIDSITWSTLIAPMQRAFTEIKFDESATLEERILAWADQFDREHPVEIHPNKGPWVRAFMKGMEGEWAMWCNGTVSTIIDHACHSMDKNMNEFIPWTWSVPQTVNFAKSKSYKCSWIDNKTVKIEDVKPGMIGIVMKNNAEPFHIFIVKKVENGVIHTYEGNTNDEGTNEGYEYVQGRRTFKQGKYGFVKLY
jgi:hypothetical protein